MIRNAWYAVLTVDEVSARPTKVRLLNRDLVVFMDQTGHLRAVHAYCPHRGCDLSLGSIVDNLLTCPYHGWKFDKDGVCRHIPANHKGGSIPRSARLQTFTARKAAGLVWVSLAAPDCAASIPGPAAAPELSDPTWHWLSFHTVWKANMCRVAESVLDISHLPFVHPETTGEDVSPIVDGPEYVMHEKNIRIYPRPFTHPMEPPNPDRLADDNDLRTEIEMWFPNQWIIRTPIGLERRMSTYLTFTPIDAETTVIWGQIGRNFDSDSDFLDVFHLEHTQFVMHQDQMIVESLRPVLPPKLKEEAHVPSDAPAIRYRHLWLQAIAQEAAT
ncbi:oxidase [Alicyclobacillus hesperidum]|uniref:Oxidase n=1 Tax=Alicyclobacillus hesperidum TaxID=89784 RepID=A0A1H2Y1M5_9BACL|nr:aromatic ring-hydroxylating dioxygenase subunit alpha [Alicyclobacillus hesperidum]GLV14451.1 oxidase [Alicyclobacillus hesperidum]SDW98479.1 Phenylpropionate dioxygenase, large terminal subunit [Alicyclobacillus hesperidum]